MGLTVDRACAGNRERTDQSVRSSTGARYRLAVRLQQPAMRDLLDLGAIRREAEGEVDVQYRPVTKRQTEWRTRRRPLVIGCSIGHHAITAGTLGAFVRPTESPWEVRVVSNNYVQAGPADSGTSPADVVGALDSFVPMRAWRCSTTSWRSRASGVPSRTVATAARSSSPALTGGRLRCCSRAARRVDSGVGIARFGEGYGVRIDVREDRADDLEVPSEVDGVPVQVVRVGPIRKL